SAEVAVNLGLVNRVVPQGTLDGAISELVEQLLCNSPAAVRAAKKLVPDMAGVVIDEALIKDTTHRIAEIRVSEEAQEGLGAFFEKREPRWTRHNNEQTDS